MDRQRDGRTNGTGMQHLMRPAREGCIIICDRSITKLPETVQCVYMCMMAENI